MYFVYIYINTGILHRSNAIIPCINFWEGLFMMVIIGAIIVIGVIYLLLKRHESRMVLIAAGILMAVIAGKPMAALDAFAKSMTNAGLITSVCSCMGFAMVMKYTGCDKHLVVAIGKVLKKWALCSYLVLLLRLLSLI